MGDAIRSVPRFEFFVFCSSYEALVRWRNFTHLCLKIGESTTRKMVKRFIEDEEQNSFVFDRVRNLLPCSRASAHFVYFSKWIFFEGKSPCKHTKRNVCFSGTVYSSKWKRYVRDTSKNRTCLLHERVKRTIAKRGRVGVCYVRFDGIAEFRESRLRNRFTAVRLALREDYTFSAFLVYDLKGRPIDK